MCVLSPLSFDPRGLALPCPTWLHPPPLSSLFCALLPPSTIPRGSFGIVYCAVDRRTGEDVAVKVMDRTRIKAASIERELTVLEHLGSNPHVVGFKGAYVTRTEVSFVMEM